jgi:hypothetical protein
MIRLISVRLGAGLPGFVRYWVLLFAPAGGFAQVAPTTAAPPTAQASKPAWADHYRKATVSFGRIVSDGPRQVFAVVGTGVIVNTDDHTGYFVTAKHVFDDQVQNWHPSVLNVRFAWQENSSVETEHGISVALKDATGKNLWESAADGSDVAAIAIPNSLPKAAFAGNGGSIDAIGLNDFATADDLYDGATIFIFGFPGIVGNDRLVRAITRSGVVAWTDPAGIDRPFLVDANVLPGNSGGPVFKVPDGMSRQGTFVVGGRVAFLGIVSQNFGQYYTVTADGRVVLTKFSDLPLPSVDRVNVNGIGGLGVIEPSERVRRLVVAMSPQAPGR